MVSIRHRISALEYLDGVSPRFISRLSINVKDIAKYLISWLDECLGALVYVESWRGEKEGKIRMQSRSVSWGGQRVERKRLLT